MASVGDGDDDYDESTSDSTEDQQSACNDPSDEGQGASDEAELGDDNQDLPDRLFGHIVSLDLASSILERLGKTGTDGIVRGDSTAHDATVVDEDTSTIWDLWDRQEGQWQDRVTAFLNAVAEKSCEAVELLGQSPVPGSFKPLNRFSTVLSSELAIPLSGYQDPINPGHQILLLPERAFELATTSPSSSFDSEATAAVDDVPNKEPAMAKALRDEGSTDAERTGRSWRYGRSHKTNDEAALGSLGRDKRRLPRIYLDKLLPPWRSTLSPAIGGPPLRPLATTAGLTQVDDVNPAPLSDPVDPQDGQSLEHQVSPPVSNAQQLRPKRAFVNLTQTLILGAYNQDDSNDSVRWLYRSLLSLLRAQPWLRFGLGLAFSSGQCQGEMQVTLVRAGQDGFEASRIRLRDRRGALDFIQIVLGMVRAADADLGAVPSMELRDRSTLGRDNPYTERVVHRICLDQDEDARCLVSRLVSSAPFIADRGIRTWAVQWDGSIASWRSFSGMAAGSRLLALRMTYQTPEDEATLKTLTREVKEKSPPQLLLAIRQWIVDAKGMPLSTIGTIHDHSEDVRATRGAETRLMQLSLFIRKRPVSAFTSLQEFVMALVDAMKGHEYLYNNGILHRNINESSIALARDFRLEKTHGYLVGLDMASRLPEPGAKSQPIYGATLYYDAPLPPRRSASPLPDFPRETKPYVAVDVLLGGIPELRHELEAFFWVLYLFLFSYDGPLSPEEPEDSCANARPWPDRLESWKDMNPYSLSLIKTGFMRNHEMVIYHFHDNQAKYFVPEANSQRGLSIVRLVAAFYTTICKQAKDGLSYGFDRNITHASVYNELQAWLDMFPDDTP